MMLNLIKQTIKFLRISPMVNFIWLNYRGLAQETYPNMNVKFASHLPSPLMEMIWKEPRETADSTYTGWTLSQ